MSNKDEDNTRQEASGICHETSGVCQETDTTVISPLASPLSGVAQVPGDKSISHRAVLFSAMAKGTSQLSGVLDSADVRSSIACVRALGAKVFLEKQEDGSFAGTISGWGNTGPHEPAEPLDCGNSGTTVRLLMGVLAPWNITACLTGDASLCQRPMRRITDPLKLMGVSFAPEGAPTLPLHEKGAAGALKALSYDSPVASAQLKTAILLAGIFASGITEVREPAPSRNHTELMLPGFGVEVQHGQGWARIQGGQTLHACDISVPGDPSSAAFLASAAVLVPKSKLCIENVSLNACRIGFVRVLKNMGARISTQLSGATGAEAYGSINIEYTPALHATEVAAQDIASLIDEVPVLALVAAHAQGTTVFRQVGELRVKETDRLAAIIEGLSQLSVHAWEKDDDLYIEGTPDVPCPDNLVFDSLGDHRLAMTWALVGLTGKASVSVRNFSAVGVSYPTFLSDIERLAQ